MTKAESKLLALQKSSIQTTLSNHSSNSLDYNSESESDAEEEDTGSIIITEETGLLEKGKSSSIYGNSTEAEQSTPLSSSPRSQLNLIPPTPIDPELNLSNSSSTATTNPHARTIAATSQEVQDVLQSRRISFNASVRISGGMKSNSVKNSPSRRALKEDMFSPINAIASTSQLPERPHHYRAGSASPKPSNSSSRSVSPSQRPVAHPRDVSNSSSLGPNGIAMAGTTSSGFPSRSSSPCSSIYAPLQPSSDTCPSSSIFVRPPVVKQRVGKERKKGFIEGWSDYLFGRAAAEAKERQDEEEEEEEEIRKENYRQIVEEQRNKKKRGNKRVKVVEVEESSLVIPRAEQSRLSWFWESIGINSKDSGSRSTGSSKNYGAISSSTPIKSKRKSRNEIVPVEEEFLGEEESPSRRRGEGRKVARRVPSNLSIQTAGVFDSTKNLTVEQPVSTPFPSVPSPPSNKKIRTSKSSEELRYGPTPMRYFNRDWIFDSCSMTGVRVKRGMAKCFAGEE